MAFDPTKPAANAPVSSAELRSQLTGLKALIDGCPTTGAMVTYVEANSAGSVPAVELLDTLASNPPTQAEVQEVIAKVNELITALKRI